MNDKRLLKLIKNPKKLKRYLKNVPPEKMDDEILEILEYYKTKIREILIPENDFFTLLNKLEEKDLNKAKEIGIILSDEDDETLKIDRLKSLIEGYSVFF